MIYLTFGQYNYMKHGMQIMQESWEYDLTTNFVKFMQQTTSPLSEGGSNVYNNKYLLQSDK